MANVQIALVTAAVSNARIPVVDAIIGVPEVFTLGASAPTVTLAVPAAYADSAASGQLFWSVCCYGTAAAFAIDAVVPVATSTNGYPCPAGAVTHIRAKAVGHKLAVVLAG